MGRWGDGENSLLFSHQNHEALQVQRSNLSNPRSVASATNKFPQTHTTAKRCKCKEAISKLKTPYFPHYSLILPRSPAFQLWKLFQKNAC